VTFSNRKAVAACEHQRGIDFVIRAFDTRGENASSPKARVGAPFAVKSIEFSRRFAAAQNFTFW
jgi:hypothetical protein